MEVGRAKHPMPIGSIHHIHPIHLLESVSNKKKKDGVGVGGVGEGNKILYMVGGGRLGGYVDSSQGNHIVKPLATFWAWIAGFYQVIFYKVPLAPEQRSRRCDANMRTVEG